MALRSADRASAAGSAFGLTGTGAVREGGLLLVTRRSISFCDQIAPAPIGRAHHLSDTIPIPAASSHWRKKRSKPTSSDVTPYNPYGCGPRGDRASPSKVK